MIRRLDERGFTLPELIIVITLVAILAVVVSPSAGVFPAMKLNAAAERVAGDLRYARMLAQREGGPVGLSFSSARAYTVVHTTARTSVPDPLRPTQALTLNTGLDERFSGITWTWDFPSLSNVLLFDSLAQPRDDAYEPALTPGTITLSLAGKTAVVTVEPITGHVTITGAS